MTYSQFSKRKEQGFVKLMEFHTGFMIQEIVAVSPDFSKEEMYQVVCFTFCGFLLTIDLATSNLGRFIHNQKVQDDAIPWTLCVRPQKFRELFESHQRPKYRPRDSLEDVFLIKHL